MYLNKHQLNKILKRIKYLKEEQTDEEIIDVIYTGKYYILQIIYLDKEEIRYDLFDEVNYITTFTEFKQVIEFLTNQ